MAGAAGVCSVKTKYKLNLNKNVFCCKSNFKPRIGIGLRQFNGNMAYRSGMIIYIFALLLVSLRCCWSGRVGGAGRAGLVVFAQLSHQAAYSDILSNGRANIWTVFRALDYLPKVTVVYFLRVRRGTSQHQTRDTNAGGGVCCNTRRVTPMPEEEYVATQDV